MNGVSMNAESNKGYDKGHDTGSVGNFDGVHAVAPMEELINRAVAIKGLVSSQGWEMVKTLCNEYEDVLMQDAYNGSKPVGVRVNAIEQIKGMRQIINAPQVLRECTARELQDYGYKLEDIENQFMAK